MNEQADTTSDEAKDERMKRLEKEMGLTKSSIKIAIMPKEAEWAKKFCNGSIRAEANRHLLNSGTVLL